MKNAFGLRHTHHIRDPWWHRRRHCFWDTCLRSCFFICKTCTWTRNGGTFLGDGLGWNGAIAVWMTQDLCVCLVDEGFHAYPASRIKSCQIVSKTGWPGNSWFDLPAGWYIRKPQTMKRENAWLGSCAHFVSGMQVMHGHAWSLFVCGKSFVIIFKHRQELRAPSVSWFFSAFGKSYVIVFKQNMWDLRTPCVNWEGPCLILVMSGNVWSFFLVFGKSYVIILARSEIVHTSSPRVNW